MEYFALFCAIAASIVVGLAAPANAPLDIEDATANATFSASRLARWLATTDAELTFIGGRPDLDQLQRRSTQTTLVVYCDQREGNVCTGQCTVYNGGAQCVDTGKVQCLTASQDVGYCDKKGCNGNCNAYSACGSYLLGGFCYTPDTKSLVISTL